MWTRSARKADGTFEYSLYGLTGELVQTVGGFATAHDADRAAEAAQRVDLFGAKADLSLDQIINSMSDDELVRELLS